eukprot:1701344-Rhodomonas_salina.3
MADTDWQARRIRLACVSNAGPICRPCLAISNLSECASQTLIAVPVHWTVQSEAASRLLHRGKGSQGHMPTRGRTFPVPPSTSLALPRRSTCSVKLEWSGASGNCSQFADTTFLKHTAMRCRKEETASKAVSMCFVH